MRAPYLDVPPVVTEEERAAELSDRLEDFLLEVGEFFPRADLRRRAQACVRGMLAPLSRKNGWQLAEHAGGWAAGCWRSLRPVWARRGRCRPESRASTAVRSAGFFRARWRWWPRGRRPRG